MLYPRRAAPSHPWLLHPLVLDQVPTSPTSRGLACCWQVMGMGMRVCAEPGCPELQPEPRCAEHRRTRERARGTREQRGYGAEHRALRAEYQRRMDEGERFSCWRCAESGRITVVDPSNWTLGHCDDDRSRYHGPECPPCDYATMGRTGCPHRSHRRPTTQVTIVCGPPCSGKSTYVRTHMQPGDLVVDYDDIARRLGSPREHDHHPSYHRPVEATIGRAIAGIKRGRHERAWVIRSGVTRARELADQLDGTVVVLDEDDAVLHERATQRPNPERTRQAIAEWRAEHSGISYVASDPHPDPL